MSRRMDKIVGVLLLAVMVFLAVPARYCEAGCRCGDGALDLVLVIDTTGSMHLAIGTVKAQMTKIVDILSGRFEELRVGVVAYRTADGPDFVVRGLPLTSDREKVKEFLADLRAAGGGSEAVYEGLRDAVGEMPYDPEARKVIILVGDEPPAEGARVLTDLVANEARTKNIIIHTITMSETAWRYFEFNNPDEFRRMKERGVDAKEMDSSFVLPSFQRMSDISGGQAVPGVSARNIVKWLLVLSSGDEELGEAAQDVMEMEPVQPDEDRSGLPPLMARIRYAPGKWDTPRDSARLLANLEKFLPVARYSMFENVSLLDDAIFTVPVLFISGHGEIEMPDIEKQRLKRYIAGGGRLWADACCGNGAFVESFRRLVKDLFPDSDLVRLPAGHKVFRAAVPVEEVRYTVEHRAPRYETGKPQAYGMFMDGRLAIVFSPHSWGAGWGSYMFSKPCLMHDDDALALSMNLIVYWMEGN